MRYDCGRVRQLQEEPGRRDDAAEDPRSIRWLRALWRRRHQQLQRVVFLRRRQLRYLLLAADDRLDAVELPLREPERPDDDGVSASRRQHLPRCNRVLPALALSLGVDDILRR